MVTYKESREYITPKDAPLETVLSVNIEDVITLEGENSKTHKPETYHRVILCTSIKGMTGFKYASLNISDDISPKNRHGVLVVAVFGKETLVKRAYTDVKQLIGKNVVVQVTGWDTKKDPEGKPLYYPKFDILDNPNAKPLKTEAIPTVCDECEQNLGKIRVTYTENGDTYVFCSEECKRAFQGTP